MKHPVCQRQKRTVAQTTSVFTAHCDPSVCLPRSMKAVLQQPSMHRHCSAGPARESWSVVLLALVQTAGLSLPNGVKDSGNGDNLMESLGTVLSMEKCKMAEMSLDHVIQTESPLSMKEHAVADHVRTFISFQPLTVISGFFIV